MAQFKVTGLDVIRDQLKERGAKVEGTVNHMLYAGAKVMREEMKAALKEYKIKDTGDLIKSIKSGKIKKGGRRKVCYRFAYRIRQARRTERDKSVCVRIGKFKAPSTPVENPCR